MSTPHSGHLGHWTEDNNDQLVEAVNTCSCTYCGVKPGQLCITGRGYIAQVIHKDREVAWAGRSGPARAPAPEWQPVALAKARIVTIEVVVPRDVESGWVAMVEKALQQLRTEEGFAAVTRSICVEQTMAEAKEVLLLREQGCE